MNNEVFDNNLISMKHNLQMLTLSYRVDACVMSIWIFYASIKLLYVQQVFSYVQVY